MEDYSSENQQVAIQIEATDLTVAPGSSVDVPLFLVQSDARRTGPLS